VRLLNAARNHSRGATSCKLVADQKKNAAEIRTLEQGGDTLEVGLIAIVSQTN